ncbi:MAG: DEAD/DEAH box helicase, partial [Bacillota bacterium]|nr:DEAD/DEAH box helicase [Bacillota bacterium]
MSPVFPDIQPGLKVSHLELGDGVVVGREPTGYVTVFFRTFGERQVPAESLRLAADRFDQLVQGMVPASAERIEKLWLAVEAEEIPLMESAATLTSAKVDLLPHQVVLVYRVANARPKRFLIADEVGLGKTIETALILRELVSRGELQRAIMIVPAGLVENWRREMNDVFNLDFEVFGSEGDVTDRKTNAFAKHNRLIVSVDTLKRRTRVKKLLEAPPWDLVVFDEAHHLSVYRNGKKVKKTENFKLAEEIKDHCRDLLLMSATPHQGDHFRFWMLINLLNPALFEDVSDMLDNRHRLNTVVIRRTKADACAQDGSPLFARRMVFTEGFSLSEKEKEFYNDLLDYL